MNLDCHRCCSVTSPVVTYQLEVYTGDQPYASTDADVYVTLYGERGDTGARHLVKSQSSETKFQQGQVSERKNNQNCFRRRNYNMYNYKIQNVLRGK